MGLVPAAMIPHLSRHTRMLIYSLGVEPITGRHRLARGKRAPGKRKCPGRVDPARVRRAPPLGRPLPPAGTARSDAPGDRAPARRLPEAAAGLASVMAE